MSEEAVKKTLSDFEKARRAVSVNGGIKGSGSEAEYARLYDRLAMLGVGNRRRLRLKYRY